MLSVVTSARAAAIAALIVAAIAAWQLYLGFYAKNVQLYFSVPHAHIFLMQGRLETAFSFSNAGNTPITIAYVAASLKMVPNLNFHPKDNHATGPTKKQIQQEHWQRIITKPMIVNSREIKTINATLCLPISFNVARQMKVSIVAYFSDYTGQLYRENFPVAKLVWTDTLAGPDKKVIGYTPLALVSGNGEYGVFKHAIAVDTFTAYASPWATPDCVRKTSSNMSLNLTVLTAGAAKIPSALRAPAAG